MIHAMERTTEFWTDFNEVYDDDYVWTSIRRMPVAIAPQEGSWVELFDSDGDRVDALVTEVRGPIIHCKVDWSTWRSHVVPEWTSVFVGNTQSSVVVNTAGLIDA